MQDEGKSQSMRWQTSKCYLFSIKRLIVLIFVFSISLSANGQQEFVSVDSLQFSRYDKPYRFIGFNFWSAVFLAHESHGDRARLLRELDTLEKYGIKNLRLMVSSEGPDTEPYRISPSIQESPGDIRESYLEALDFVLVELSKRNMTAVLCLGNSWHWSGGFAQYYSWASGKSIPYPNDHDYDKYMKFTSKFYSSKEARKYYQEYITKILTRTNTISKQAYKNDPTIMSWELANEPYALKRKHYLKWIKESTSLIRQLAPNHLITLGSEGMTNYPKYTKNDARVDFAFENIDYITIHTWPQNWEWYDPKLGESQLAKAIAKTKDYIHVHLDIAYRLKKPLVLEEFGLARDKGSCEAEAKLKCRDAYFESICKLLLRYAHRNSPFCGINMWAWGGEGRPREHGGLWKQGDEYTGDPPHEPQGWYSIYDKDLSTLEMIKKYLNQL